LASAPVVLKQCHHTLPFLMPTTTVKPGDVDAGDADDAEAGRCGQARDGREELDVKPGDADAKRATPPRKPGDADKPAMAARSSMCTADRSRRNDPYVRTIFVLK
jgi:hypothetical protein